MNILYIFLNFIKKADYIPRLQFTFLLLVLYRFFCFLHIPGIDVEQLGLWIDNISKNYSTFNLFSGGSLQRISVMVLSIGPSISASIMMHFLGAVYEPIKNLKKDLVGRNKIAQYTKYLTLIMAIFQSIYFVRTLMLFKGERELVMFNTYGFIFLSVMIVTCCSMLAFWIGEQISYYGIGNGSSLMLYVGIVSIKKSMTISSLFLVLIFFVVFMENSFKVIMFYKPTAAYSIPSPLYMRFNPAGIYPPMFAGSVLAGMKNIISFLKLEKYSAGAWFFTTLEHGSYSYNIAFAVIIFLTTYVYSELNFNPESVAKNLQEQNFMIRGYRPGKETQAHLEDQLFNMSILGGLYLGLICVFAEMLSDKEANFYLGGTTLIILIGVAVDIVNKIHASIQTEITKSIFTQKRKR